MLSYLLRRLVISVPVLLAIIIVSFFLMRFAPGGPFDREKVFPPAIEKNLRAQYHLDEPLAAQCLRYIGGLATGDLGVSMKYPDLSVSEIIAQSLPVSMVLGLLALAVALAVGLPGGIIGAVRKGAWPDHATMTLAMIGISVPTLVIGPLLILLFSFRLAVFPSGGWGGASQIVLPAVTLSAPFAAYIARLARSGMLEALNRDYIRTARAKGLSEAKVVLRHAIREALLPVISFLGPAAAAVMTGSVVVEKIFDVPGMGKHFVNGALNRDYPLVLGCVIVYSILIVIFNLAVDLGYGILDVRVKYD